MAAVNEVLSEVIDVVLALRQAHHRVPEGHALHAELDQLFSDAKTWAGQLMEADVARDVSALAYMPSVAGRQPPDLGHGPMSDDDIRQIVAAQLERLAAHLRTALSEQQDENIGDLLSRIGEGIQDHLVALR
jgi:DNA-binding ferritin-like protein